MESKFLDRNYPYLIIVFMLFMAVLIAGKIGEKYYTEGVSAAKQGDYVTAIYWFEKAIPLRPRDPKVYFANANAYAALARMYDDSVSTAKNDNETEDAFLTSDEYIANAVSDYNMAIKLNPKCADYYYARAMCVRGERPFEAFADFDRVIKANPRNIEAYYYRGLTYFEGGNYKLAIADATRVISLNPNYAEAYCIRGASLYFRYYKNKPESDYQKAMSDFNTAIKIKPSYDKAYYYRSLAYKHNRDFIHAISDAKKQLGLKPNDSKVHLNLAGVYFESGDHKNAISTITTLINMQPENTQAYESRANYYDLMGMKEAARLDREKIKSLLSN